MKQTIQQTELQQATQPVVRYIKAGLEQFYIHDTDDAIQQQADDNTVDLEYLHLRKKKKENASLDAFTHDLSDPTQIDDIMASTTTSNSRGYLRGSSSSSTASIPEEDKLDDTKVSSSDYKTQGYLRGSSSSSAAAAILE